MLTYDQKVEISNILNGTSDSGIELAEKYGVDLDEIESVMGELGYEMCSSCNVWTETSDLDEDNGECSSCR